MSFRGTIAACLLPSLMLCSACAADSSSNSNSNSSSKSSSSSSSAYDAALAPCHEIDADRHWTGLVFNPRGHATGYYRARCIQQVAEVTRAAELCTGVLERRSWLFDGSGTSPAACARAVEQRVRRDWEAAAQLQGIQRLTRVALHRDGNGRDINVVVGFSGGSGHGLWLTLEAIGRDGSPRTLRSQRQPLDDAPGEVTLHLELADVTRALGAPIPSEPVTIRATLARRLRGADERAAHALAPHVRLSSSIETRVALDRLARAPLTHIGATAD